MHGPGNQCDGDVESDQADHDRKPEKEGNQPILVFAMNNDTGNPPSDFVRIGTTHNGSTLRLTR